MVVVSKSVTNVLIHSARWQKDGKDKIMQASGRNSLLHFSLAFFLEMLQGRNRGNLVFDSLHGELLGK